MLSLNPVGEKTQTNDTITEMLGVRSQKCAAYTFLVATLCCKRMIDKKKVRKACVCGSLFYDSGNGKRHFKLWIFIVPTNTSWSLGFFQRVMFGRTILGQHRSTGTERKSRSCTHVLLHKTCQRAWSFHAAVLQRTAKKSDVYYTRVVYVCNTCTKHLYYTRA